jgi:hypothetical protein
MDIKTPVVLLVLVETAQLRWFAMGVGLDGPVIPLLCSEAGDLERYLGLDFDEQVAFLRHRFCGVLQRACDRLWTRGKKAKQFVLLFDGQLAEHSGRLTSRIAEHLAEWMLDPPIAVFSSPASLRQAEPRRLDRLAGQIPPLWEELLYTSLDTVLVVREDPSVWELTRKKND